MFKRIVIFIAAVVLAIILSTQSLAQDIIRVYPIQDILFEVPDFDDAPSLRLDITHIPIYTPYGWIYTPYRPFYNSAFQQVSTKPRNTDKKMAIKAQKLIEIIKDLVGEDNIKIHYFEGNLIVKAPKEVHELIR